MSGANIQAGDITLEELARLIKLLGMLGSSFDPEVLVAAKFAHAWVVEHATSWDALLVPEPLPGVSGVVAPPDQDALDAALKAAHDADRAQAFKNGYAAGMRDMAQQVKAQAAAMAAPHHAPARGPGGFQSPPSAFNANQQPRQGPAPQNAPGGPGAAGGPSWSQPGISNPYPAGSWMDIAWALLNRDASGIPGVFRGSREADFVASLLARGWRTLTGPQETWLRDIAGRSGMSW